MPAIKIFHNMRLNKIVLLYVTGRRACVAACRGALPTKLADVSLAPLTEPSPLLEPFNRRQADAAGVPCPI
jgi:hypothetical protein